MNKTSILRLAAATVAAALACAAVPAGAVTAPSTDHPREQRQTTTLTFEVPDCDGCTLQLTHGRWRKDGEGLRVWESKEREVRDGTVRIRVPNRRTHGLSVLVRAPWEGHTGYVATVAFRYDGTQPGDQVGFREARNKRMGSACWAGTDAASVTIPLTVRKVRVGGVHERVNGSIAYADTTQDWLDPMRRVWDGVMGSQDANICGERPN